MKEQELRGAKFFLLFLSEDLVDCFHYVQIGFDKDCTRSLVLLLPECQNNADTEEYYRIRVVLGSSYAELSSCLFVSGTKF